METFEYEPLRPPRDPDGVNMIRLIRIIPSDKMRDDEIHCSIKHFPLQNPPIFVALSYCWGDPTIKHPIWCNNGKLFVAANLHSALVFLRHSLWLSRLETTADGRTQNLGTDSNKHDVTWLWVDALCINQSDVQEKNFQVPLMSRIYGQAQETTIWLGDRTETSNLGMQLMPRLAKAMREFGQNGERDIRYLDNMDEEALRRSDIPPASDPAYPELFYLLERPWFSRVWIIQEVAFSKNLVVRCGGWTSTWDDLVDATSFCNTFGMGPQYGSGAGSIERVISIDIARHRITKNIQQPLLGFLNLYRRFQATDQRDKIFALCGMAADAGANGLNVEPDYGTKVDELYKSITVSILSKSQNLDILSASKPSGNSSVGGLPSWVPDWSIWNSTLPLRGLPFGPNDPNFTATPASLPCSLEFSDDTNIIGISGHTVDTIAEIGEIFRYNNDPGPTALIRRLNWQAVFNSWETTSRYRSVPQYVTGEPSVDAYWQTLVSGHVPDDFSTTKEKFHQWDRGMRSIARYLPLSYLGPYFYFLSLPLSFIPGLCRYIRGTDANKAEDFYDRISFSIQRRLFRTCGGYIGQASQQAQAGDHIGLFKGGLVPLVIREEGTRWRLIGDCYVHGIMQGQAFLEEKCKTMWFL